MERRLLIITSTYGDGDPPDNAVGFWQALSAEAAPKLSDTRFSVCALGDTNYAAFCAFGIALDQRLEELGAGRICSRAQCDVEYEESFCRWLTSALGSEGEPVSEESEAAEVAAAPAGADRPGRANPVPARLVSNRKLTTEKSSKEVRHLEFSLAGSGVDYEAGDALGVWPSNCPDLVAELLHNLDCDGEEAVLGREGEPVTLRAALSHHYDITRVAPPLLDCVARYNLDPVIGRICSPAANGQRAEYLRGREVIDLLGGCQAAKPGPEEFISSLRKLQPRLYSISSSPKAHPGEVHLTVGIVRYEAHGRSRKGVCSTFLADRVGRDGSVPVFAHANKLFKLPAPDCPLIMVGPGTGIAPFRAFLEERRAIQAPGRNWLFFGDQHASDNFLYQEEIEQIRADGYLHRLDLAWSRDQERKVYVQHRMLERARELYGWLEEGAGFYVCGDAARMAKDVDAALRQVIMEGGGRTKEGADEYIRDLKASRRYCRDVY